MKVAKRDFWSAKDKVIELFNEGVLKRYTLKSLGLRRNAVAHTDGVPFHDTIGRNLIHLGGTI